MLSLFREGGANHGRLVRCNKPMMHLATGPWVAPHGTLQFTYLVILSNVARHSFPPCQR